MQSSVNDALQVGLPGGLYGVNKDVISRNNYSKKLDEVTVTAADLATTCTINGTAFTVNAGAAVLTKAALAALLATAINAGAEPVTAYYVALAETLTVESDVVGTTTTVVGTTNCSVVAQIGNAAAIDFGLLVSQDILDDDKARVPIVATDITSDKKVLGITVHTQAIEQFYESAGGAGYALNAEMSILQKGTVWVQVEETVTNQSVPYARFTVSGTTKLGGIRASADSGKAAIIPNAKFVRGAAADGFALLYINLI